MNPFCDPLDGAAIAVAAQMVGHSGSVGPSPRAETRELAHGRRQRQPVRSPVLGNGVLGGLNHAYRLHIRRINPVHGIRLQFVFADQSHVQGPLNVSPRRGDA